MYTVNWITPFRMTPEHELLGADLVEHGIEKTHTEARESIEGNFVQNLIVNDQVV